MAVEIPRHEEAHLPGKLATHPIEPPWVRSSSLRAVVRSVVAPSQPTPRQPARASPTAVSRLSRFLRIRSAPWPVLVRGCAGWEWQAR